MYICIIRKSESNWPYRERKKNARANNYEHWNTMKKVPFVSFPPQPASPLIRSTVNLLRDKVKWNHSSHAGVGTGRNFQFPSSSFSSTSVPPCRSITARTVCTALRRCNPIYQCHESAATRVPRLRGPPVTFPPALALELLGPEHPGRLANVDVGKSSVRETILSSWYRVSNSRVCTVNLPEREREKEISPRFFGWKYRVVIVLLPLFFFWIGLVVIFVTKRWKYLYVISCEW